MNSKKEQIQNMIDEIIQVFLENNEYCHIMMNSSTTIIRITGKQCLNYNNFNINELIQLKYRNI
jgi:hypothetical protein